MITSVFPVVILGYIVQSAVWLKELCWHVIIYIRLVSLCGSKKMSDESDYYTVLGIPKNATDTDIRKAYVLTELLEL